MSSLTTELRPGYSISRIIKGGWQLAGGHGTFDRQQAIADTHGIDRIIGADDLQAQTVYILDKISASLSSLGASMNDVVRTRIYLKDASNWEAVSRVHGRYFAQCLPANTLIEVSNLVGNFGVEIEAEAVVD